MPENSTTIRIGCSMISCLALGPDRQVGGVAPERSLIVSVAATCCAWLTRPLRAEAKPIIVPLFDVSASQLGCQVTGTSKTATCHLIPATEYGARKSIAHGIV
jgi:hypothetical protein